MDNNPKLEKLCILRKEVKRLTKSRDGIKVKSRDKAQTIKNYQDRLQEVTESRDRWKKSIKEEKRTTNQLQNKISRQNEMLSEVQAERDELLKEVHDLKKNFKRF